MTYKFCTELDRIMQDPRFAKNRIFHYCGTTSAKKANAAYLMGAYQVLILKRSADESWRRLSHGGPFKDFRDASQGPCYYKCTIQHCLRGLEKAVELNWFNIKTFDSADYEHREKVENGDFNWIVPGKFLAFSNPADRNTDSYGYHAYTPDDYVPLFKKMNITGVVRLNNRTYDESKFTRRGINHYELFFTDGSVPPSNIISQFMRIAESEPGALAIHCKAGLGRTGTLIGLYCMKHYGFKPEDFIGWNRIARPGSVLGPQQKFLCEYTSSKHGYRKSLSADEEYIAKYGDAGQAGKLMSAKKSNQGTPCKSDISASPSSKYSSSPQMSPYRYAGGRAASIEPSPQSYNKQRGNQTPGRYSPAKAFAENYRNSPPNIEHYRQAQTHDYASTGENYRGIGAVGFRKSPSKNNIFSENYRHSPVSRAPYGQNTRYRY